MKDKYDKWFDKEDLERLDSYEKLKETHGIDYYEAVKHDIARLEAFRVGMKKIKKEFNYFIWTFAILGGSLLALQCIKSYYSGRQHQEKIKQKPVIECRMDRKELSDFIIKDRISLDDTLRITENESI